MASRLPLMLKGKWFLTPLIHMNHSRLMTALTQSCSFLHHVLLEVRLKPYNLTFSASNINFSGEVSKHLFCFSCCSADYEGLAYSLYSRFDSSRTWFWGNIRRSPRVTEVRKVNIYKLVTS